MAECFNIPPTDIPENPTQKEGWTALTTYASQQEAAIVAGALESEGIPSMVTNGTMNSVLPIGFNTIGGVSLWVPAEMADKALMILRRNKDLGQ